MGEHRGLVDAERWKQTARDQNPFRLRTRPLKRPARRPPRLFLSDKDFASCTMLILVLSSSRLLIRSHFFLRIRLKVTLGQNKLYPLFLLGHFVQEP